MLTRSRCQIGSLPQILSALAKTRQQSPQGIALHDLNGLDFGGGRNQLENLLDVDLHAVVGEAGVAEDDAQGFAGCQLLDEILVDGGLEFWPDTTTTIETQFANEVTARTFIT